MINPLKMKKHILTLTLFVAFTAASFAQQEKQTTPEERATRTTAMMEKNLSLTADQKTKIYDITLERIKATTALKSATGEGDKPDVDKMKAINEKYNASIKGILTAEQQAKMEEMRSKRSGGNGGKKPKDN